MDKGKNFLQLLNPDNTMSFNRLLAHAIGATETIIYFCLISKMMYYSSRNLLSENGFFYATALDIQESTTFTQRQQSPAIKKLVSLGLIDTKLKGLPAKKYYRIIYNQDLILSLIEQGRIISDSIRDQKKGKIVSDVKTSIDKMSKLDESKENSQIEQNVKSSNDIMSNQDITNCQNRFEQNVETCIDKMSKKSKYNNLNIINLNNNNPSINQSSNKELMDRIDRCREEIKQNIDYNVLISPEYQIDKQQLDGIVELITDIVAVNTAPVKIGGNILPADVVKARFNKLTSTEITYVLEALSETTTRIKDIRSYLLTSLYNASSTVTPYWQNRMHHDMATFSEQKKEKEAN